MLCIIIKMVTEIKDLILKVSPYHKKRGGPISQHNLVYDSSAETLEPVYFFILDLMNDFGLKPEKLVDNFTSSPGGTHFSEVGMKSSRLQDEAMKIMGSVNTVLRSILNIVYDLKDFKVRLEHYENMKSNDKDRRDAAILSLKQIWLDKVDIDKGNSSIKAMALGQGGFQTLIDAFLVVNSEKDVDKLDLNDRVKRIIKPRIQEFYFWITRSEQELRKRYELEKTYLRSQVSSLKIYSRWVRPYLKSIEDLRMEDRNRSPEIVNMFNTVVFQLTLLDKSKINIHDMALAGELPREFKKFKARRDYFSVVLVDFTFRAIPRQQGLLVGRTDVTFRGYALNQDEIDKLDEEIDKSDMGEIMRLIEGATTESLDLMQKEIDEFLNEDNKKEKKRTDQSNPFLALMGKYNDGDVPAEKKSEKKDKKKAPAVVKPDDWVEANHLRRYVSGEVEGTVFKLFDIYKKGHGMASFT